MTPMELQAACSVEGCPRPPVARRLCRRHYQRWRTHATPIPGGLPDPTRPRCAVPACPRYVNARGLCFTHWHQAKMAGAIRPRRPVGARERFERRLLRTPDGCLLFTGSGDDPYGQFVAFGKHWRPRRWAWEAANGPVPPNCELRARCGQTRCCEPSHMVVVLGTWGRRRSSAGVR